MFLFLTTTKWDRSSSFCDPGRQISSSRPSRVIGIQIFLLLKMKRFLYLVLKYKDGHHMTGNSWTRVTSIPELFYSSQLLFRIYWWNADGEIMQLDSWCRKWTGREKREGERERQAIYICGSVPCGSQASGIQAPNNYQVTFRTPLSMQLGSFPYFTLFFGILSIRSAYQIESLGIRPPP